ncbi:UDP-glucose 4-epimerase GalE [Algicola sagamiensis]|uniref:UDP-glucose 4-epimerase GalE n=1 Tax=Algicola sagamiensis TaxID=163869 RepID=UPI00037E23F0|nr:UDP-glucose 4-epimerase GalE [Algicola sagamiensis]
MILVTGGAGYIGSHTLVELINQSESVVVIDNLQNSTELALEKVKEITGKDLTFYQGDIGDAQLLKQIFEKHPIKSVIHFAASKSVNESVSQPLAYYRNNISATVTLLECMAQFNIKNIIYSSSAAVYGDPVYTPMDEAHPIGPITPYGKTKYFGEQILADLAVSDSQWNIVMLRYFNPIGAHHSGLIGEDPLGEPRNLLPYLTQVAIGKRKVLSIFGQDYNTIDGTPVRDYIHVVDLAKGHVQALNLIQKQCGLKVLNLGTGKPTSVLELVSRFEAVTGQKLPYQMMPRREGDAECCYAAPDAALKEMSWKTELSLDNMLEDAWHWQSKNPNGYN